MTKDFTFDGKNIRITAYADGIVRVHMGDVESLFDRYNLLTKPEDCGAEIENGVAVDGLSVTLENGVITFKTDRVTRTVDLACPETEAVKEYFNKETGNLRPAPKQIIGEDAIRSWGTVDFQKNPKYFTIRGVEDERFYGFGAANPDRLVLNGKVYLQRVVYQSNEMPVPFLMTKAGYGILCNSTWWHAVDVCAKKKDEIQWYLPDGDVDFFIFAGDSLADLLERFTYVVGRPALLPKWAYGLAFLDQYTADQYEVMRNAAEFRRLGLPCDSISLEPGWMEKRYDFSVNKKWSNGPRGKFLIEEWARKNEYGNIDPNFFTAALARYGFKLHLWLCCEHDFTVEEERRIGNEIDPETPDWFTHLKAFMNDGASSFKLDPCHTVDNANEGRVYANGKADPEMHNLIQTIFMRDMARGSEEHTGKRAMHHYCGAYTGTGAYSAASTGDNGGGLSTLAWTLTCGMSGISNLTCDMDIFKKDGLHYCFFTAWCQLNSWYGFSHPWWAGEEMEPIFEFYDKLRYRLLPYIYSTTIKANLTGMPVARAMPLMYEDEELQNAISEYMFGEQFLVGAFDESIYLPAGSRWIDYWTGKVYEGGQTVTGQIPENRGGYLFVKSGAIIPTDEPKQYTKPGDTKHIILDMYPDGASYYDFYEDDGESLEFREGKRAVTRISMVEGDGIVNIAITDREGEFKGIGERVYTARVFADKAPASVEVDGEAAAFTYENGFIAFEMDDKKEAVVTFG